MTRGPEHDFEEHSALYGGPTVRAGELVFTLVGLDGPGAGLRVEIAPAAPGPVVIGNAERVDVRIADRHLSRRHLALEVEGARLAIRDLGSTNGSFVGGVAIQTAWAKGGETLQIGATRFEIVARRAARGEAEIPAAEGFGALAGQSAELRRLYPLFARLASADVTVLIEGETGTGKEVLAESIHAESRRRGGPFVVFDCTTIAPTLFESELFGHERGAFSGATEERRGLFESAHKGTLFIDEIGELDPSLQAKLLRAVETAKIRRVGGSASLSVDVRIITATRRDLDREVQEGRFRDDLFHRLAISRVELPPLRRRATDVRFLAGLFWARLGGAPPGPPAELLSAWEAYAWPGNVRELRNHVARAIALGELAETPRERASTNAPGGTLDGLLARAVAEGRSLPDAREELVRAFERAFLGALDLKHGGDAAKVAAAAGVTRRYVNMIRARAGR